jgi:hypothetical protein
MNTCGHVTNICAFTFLQIVALQTALMEVSTRVHQRQLQLVHDTLSQDEKEQLKSDMEEQKIVMEELEPVGQGNLTINVFASEHVYVHHESLERQQRMN